MKINPLLISVTILCAVIISTTANEKHCKKKQARNKLKNVASSFQSWFKKKAKSENKLPSDESTYKDVSTQHSKSDNRYDHYWKGLENIDPVILSQLNASLSNWLQKNDKHLNKFSGDLVETESSPHEDGMLERFRRTRDNKMQKRSKVLTARKMGSARLFDKDNETSPSRRRPRRSKKYSSGHRLNKRSAVDSAAESNSNYDYEVASESETSEFNPWDFLMPKDFWEEFPFINDDLNLTLITNDENKPTTSVTESMTLGISGGTIKEISSLVNSTTEQEDYDLVTSNPEEFSHTMSTHKTIPSDQTISTVEVENKQSTIIPQANMKISQLHAKDAPTSFGETTSNHPSLVELHQAFESTISSEQKQISDVDEFKDLKEFSNPEMVLIHGNKPQTVNKISYSNQVVLQSSEKENRPIRVGSVRGIPGVHFPNYHEIPLTSFTCSRKKTPGYYADIETACQVFHVCYAGRRESFLCPVGTTFNQAISTCDFWYSSNCSLTNYYVDQGKIPIANSVLSNDKVSYSPTTTAPSDSTRPVSRQNGSTNSIPKVPPTAFPEKIVQTPTTNFTNIAKFLPIKSKVTIYPAAGGKRAKVISETSIGHRNQGSKRRINNSNRIKIIHKVFKNSTHHIQKGINPEVNKVIEDAFDIARQVLEEVGSLFPRRTTPRPRRPVSTTSKRIKLKPLPTLNPRFIVKPVYPERNIHSESGNKKYSATFLDDNSDIRKS